MSIWSFGGQSSASLVVAALLCGGWGTVTEAGDSRTRDRNARASFQRANPCPSTGMRRGPCPGYVVDHIATLCAGGADSPENMQWQTTTEAKIKDRAERAICRAP